MVYSFNKSCEFLQQEGSSAIAFLSVLVYNTPMTQTKTSPKILRTDTIQNVFDTFPDRAQKLAEIMTSNGLHCVGCHASVFETLEQGILGHGFSEEKLGQMLGALNEVVSGEVEIATISLSVRAAQTIKDLLAKEGKAEWGLRFGLSPHSEDFEYELTFREEAMPGEKTLEDNDMKIFVSQLDWPKLVNTKIDFVENDEGAGFKINNPNEP